jgi:hypothetical protein
MELLKKARIATAAVLTVVVTTHVAIRPLAASRPPLFVMIPTTNAADHANLLLLTRSADPALGSVTQRKLAPAIAPLVRLTRPVLMVNGAVMVRTLNVQLGNARREINSARP